LLRCNNSDPAFLLKKSYRPMWKLRALPMRHTSEIDHVSCFHTLHSKTIS